MIIDEFNCRNLILLFIIYRFIHIPFGLLLHKFTYHSIPFHFRIHIRIRIQTMAERILCGEFYLHSRTTDIYYSLRQTHIEMHSHHWNLGNFIRARNYIEPISKLSSNFKTINVHWFDKHNNHMAISMSKKQNRIKIITKITNYLLEIIHIDDILVFYVCLTKFENVALHKDTRHFEYRQ